MKRIYTISGNGYAIRFNTKKELNNFCQLSEKIYLENESNFLDKNLLKIIIDITIAKKLNYKIFDNNLENL